MQFVARALSGQRYPATYRDMAEINLAGPKLLGLDPAAPTKLSADAVAAFISKGAAVVVDRQGRDYDRGHIPGSFSVSLDGPFSAWVGWLIPEGRTIVLAGGTDAQHREAQRQLHRIGFDSVAGAIDGGIAAWNAGGRELSTFETVDVEDMAAWILSAEPMTVVDARDEHEWSGGHVPGAVHIYVPDVPFRAAEIPIEAPVAVHCASGYRAGIAASLLEQAGLKRIMHGNGPYSDWDRLHLAESKP